jgi:rare lipoprotein A
MRKLVMGCAMAGLIALSPTSEAMPPVYVAAIPSLQPIAIPHGQIGLASWYGPECQGLHTASGDLFDTEELTAAHRNLPFGAVVRVTNLKNHESVLLKINDRGPGINTRMIDVSMEAAKKLGFLEAGLARVEVNVLSFPNTCAQHLNRAHSPRLN